MIVPRHTAANGSAKPPIFRFFTFTCACCEETENRRDATAPAGWVIRYIDETSYVFCPDCVADLAQEDVQ